MYPLSEGGGRKPRPEDGRNLLDRLLPRVMAACKTLAYRTPILRHPLLPRYPYWVDPGTLAEMLRLIDEPRNKEGAIVEVGVARGITSVFLLEHMKTTRDPRPLVMIDTFHGFTAKAIQHEVAHRNRRKRDLANFSYGSAAVLRKSLNRLGYRNFRIIAGDCEDIDWRDIGRVAGLLLDVDLYRPTLATLDAVWPLLCPHGGIVVDDCIEPHWADGSLEAYTEFIKRHALPFIRIGGKAAGVRRIPTAPSDFR